MGKMITLEDVNTTVYNNQGFYWHKIDTTKISSDSDFDWTKYDFCEVKRETSSTGYFYSFKITSSKWTKGIHINEYYLFYLTPQGIDLKIYSTSPTLTVYLYMGSLSVTDDDYKIMDNLLKEDILNLKLDELNTPQKIYYKRYGQSGYNFFIRLTLNKGYNFIETAGSQPDAIGYLLVNLVKTDFQFNCTQTLTVGKINKVLLGTNNDYKPNGALIGSYTPSITVSYGNKVLPVLFDGTDYYFDLDLTNKSEIGKVRFTVNVEANEVLNETVTNVVLNSQYETVNTFNALLSALGNGDNLIRVGSDLVATSNILIESNVKIVGNDNSIDLNGHSFILNESVELIIENMQLNSGNNAIKQGKNTKVELTDCTFRYNTTSNGLGSIIYCDIDYPSLSVTDDFSTILTRCKIYNNESAIYHGGELTINDCEFLQNESTYLKTNSPSLLYQVDGNTRITNSVFDIDFDENNLCESEENINFGQCLFLVGENASVNNSSYNDLKENDIGNFFDGTTNNRSHVFAKYYYPSVSACVYTSPQQYYENKCLCYGLSGDDYIYKVNCQVTRAEWDSQNENRTIRW